MEHCDHLQTNLDSEMFFPVIGQALVELSIFLGCNIVWVTSPKRFGLVQLLILSVLLFDGLFLLFISFLFIVVIIFVYIFYLGLLLHNEKCNCRTLLQLHTQSMHTDIYIPK